MADTQEETPAQRQARIRRQKREAKITGAGAERLEKITKLSGRTPESMRNESPAQTPPQPSTPLINDTTSPQRIFSPPANQTTDPAQLKAQEDFFRAMMRAAPPETQQQAGPDAQIEDPMLKLLSQMLGSAEGGSDPNAPGQTGFSPADISKATGIPSFLTNMMMGNQAQPPSPKQIQQDRLWKTLHTIFALVVGVYLVIIVESSTMAFGLSPPAPATFKNPFVVFMMGELMIQSTRIVLAGQSGQNGPKLWWKMLKEIAGDGAIVVFALGIASWWRGP